MFQKCPVQIFLEFQRTVEWLSSKNQSKAWFLEREDRILFAPEINPVQLSTPSGAGDLLCQDM